MKKEESDLQIDVSEDIKQKWQDIVETMAKLIGVPTGLIMRIIEPDIEVFVSSKTANNPYNAGDRMHLFGSGLYCETVIKTGEMLLVPNALSDEKWKNNPDIKLNMISYLGFPILLPDGQTFGTICVLDNKENRYSDIYVKLIKNFKDIIESNLELIYMNHILGEKNQKLSDFISEIQTLKGILRICSYCKRIQTKDETWESLESYISKRSEVKFSHGLCPECFKKKYPNYEDS